MIKLSVPGRVWGPAGDHTLCAMVHDLRVCARYARTQHGQLPAVTCENAIPRCTGGQVVAGSNPVSPTIKRPSELAFSIFLDCTNVRQHPKSSQIVTSIRFVSRAGVRTR